LFLAGNTDEIAESDKKLLRAARSGNRCQQLSCQGGADRPCAIFIFCFISTSDSRNQATRLRAEFLLGIAQVTAVVPAEAQSLCSCGAGRNATLAPMPQCGELGTSSSLSENCRKNFNLPSKIGL
jgi:hypothetical protein